MSYYNRLTQRTNDIAIFITVVEIIIYGQMAWPLGWLYTLFIVAFVYTLSFQTNILFEIAEDLGKRQEFYRKARLVNLTIFARLIVLAFSLCVALASFFVHSEQKKLENNPAMLSAEQQIEIAQSNLQISQAALTFSEGEHQMAQGEKSRLESDIAAERGRLKSALAEQITAWTTAKDIYMALPNVHASSITNADAMEPDCSPKLAKRGGMFRTAARKACPKWKAILAKEPKFDNTPQIVEMQTLLKEQQLIITEFERVKRYKNGVVIALQNKADLITQLTGGVSYDSGFELIIVFLRGIFKGLTGIAVVGILSFLAVFVLVSTFSLTQFAKKIQEVHGPSTATGSGEHFVYDEPEHTTWYKKLWHWFTSSKVSKGKFKSKPNWKNAQTKDDDSPWITPKNFLLTFSDSYNLNNSQKIDGEIKSAGLIPTESSPSQFLVVANEPDFEKATSLIKSGGLRPTQYALIEWAKQNCSNTLTIRKINKWLKWWHEAGLTEPTLAQNGKQTYRLKA